LPETRVEGRPEFQECPVPRALLGVKPDRWIQQEGTKLMISIHVGLKLTAGQVPMFVWRQITKCNFPLYMRKNLSHTCLTLPFESLQCRGKLHELRSPTFTVANFQEGLTYKRRAYLLWDWQQGLKDRPFNLKTCQILMIFLEVEKQSNFTHTRYKGLHQYFSHS